MGRRIRRVASVGVVGAVVAAACAATGGLDEVPLERFEYRRLAMGCEARLVLYAPDEGTARDAAQEAFARLSEIEAATSDYRIEGPLVDLAREAGGEALRLPLDLHGCLWSAKLVAAESDGAFDPTAAPLTHLWREARGRGEVPAAAEIAAARGRVGHERLELELGEPLGRLADPGMALDLGGIAKGYAASVLLEVLGGRGLDHVLVDVGGDLAVGAAPPGRDAWSILAGAGDGARVLHLEHACVATSGATEQFVELDGRRFSHLIDPRTGRGVTHDRIVTVVTNRPSVRAGALADALASAASVLNDEEALAMIARVERAASTALGAFNARLIIQNPDARPLFDGESLDGWTTTGGRYDGQAAWSVEDGELVGRTGPDGAGGLIYTDGFYTACELEFEVRMDYPYDSGVFLRMLPPDSGLKGAQVTLDHRPGGEIAGIYADGWLEHNPEAEQHFAKDAWNHVRVRTTGFDFRIEVWINGEKVTDYQLPEGTPGYAPHGRIGLQVHGADAEAATRSVRFRNIRVRELPIFGEELFTDRPAHPAGVLQPGPEAAAAGWRDLLADGMEGLVPRGDLEGYRLNRGVLEIPASGGGEIATADDFRDFRLSADFKIAEMANSGLYLRSARAPGNPSYSGCEIQILDDFNWERVTESTLAPYQFTGSLYGAAAAPPLELKGYRPPGEWNRFEVLYDRTRLAVALNGLTMFDVDTADLEVEPPFAERAATGFIGFQRYGAPTVTDAVAAQVRNFFVDPIETSERR